MHDFGAGSRYFKSPNRTVSKIAGHAGISLKRSKLLFRVIRHLNTVKMLELGTSVGLASCAMSLANPDGSLQTIEGCGETLKCAQNYFSKLGLPNIETFCGTFDEFPLKENQTFDLIFFDGHHQKEATLRYFDKFLPTAHNDSVWIFDDIHWSEGMQQAWEAIKSHEAVQVTIDTFQWGFVFFRKEQAKEHFTIKL
jgi:predicted O-methyltransferase YrrM